jgi:hypothetical protein
MHVPRFLGLPPLQSELMVPARLEHRQFSARYFDTATNNDRLGVHRCLEYGSPKLIGPFADFGLAAEWQAQAVVQLT